MKTWTVVLEIHDHNNESFLLTTQAIKSMVEDRLEGNLPPAMGFAIFECTEAPYGPQGVVLTESKPPAVIHRGRLIDCPDVRSGKSTHCRGHIQNNIGRAGRVQTAPKGQK